MWHLRSRSTEDSGTLVSGQLALSPLTTLPDCLSFWLLGNIMLVCLNLAVSEISDVFSRHRPVFSRQGRVFCLWKP